MKSRTGLAGAVATVLLFGGAFTACVEPPPKIAAIPPNGLAVRLFVFGASAQDARRVFDAAKLNNKNFSVVREGGDGEVLVGLENDSPKCVAPTALCSFKVAVRIRDNHGKVVHASTESATANAERCADLCARALNAVIVKVVETAAGALKSGDAASDAGAPVDPSEGGIAEATDTADASVTSATTTATAMASTSAAKPSPKRGGKAAAAKPEPPPPPSPKAEPAICIVGHGPTLPAEEAEKRAAQVEVLKRLEILDQEEYDCLRKAYLDRL